MHLGRVAVKAPPSGLPGSAGILAGNADAVAERVFNHQTDDALDFIHEIVAKSGLAGLIPARLPLNVHLRACLSEQVPSKYVHPRTGASGFESSPTRREWRWPESQRIPRDDGRVRPPVRASPATRHRDDGRSGRLPGQNTSQPLGQPYHLGGRQLLNLQPDRLDTREDRRAAPDGFAVKNGWTGGPCGRFVG